MLRFPESDLSDLVYLEQLTGSLYLDKGDEVAQYDRAMTQLQRDSPPPEDTRSIIRDILRTA